MTPPSSKQISPLLMQALALPVEYWDERLTSQEAERTLIAGGVRRRKRKQVVDQVAAVLILQGYLDSVAGEPLLDE